MAYGERQPFPRYFVQAIDCMPAAMRGVVLRQQDNVAGMQDIYMAAVDQLASEGRNAIDEEFHGVVVAAA